MLEPQIEDAEAALSEDELAAEHAGSKTVTLAFVEHFPRERVVVPGPTAAPSC